MDQYISAITICSSMVICPSPLKHKLSYGCGENGKLAYNTYCRYFVVVSFLDSSGDSGKFAYNNSSGYLYLFRL